MPLKSRSGTGDEPRLKISLTEAHDFVRDRIAAGETILGMSVTTNDELDELARAYKRWTKYNDEWLSRRVGQTVADAYSGRGIPYSYISSPDLPQPTLADHAVRYKRYVADEIENLRSIDDQFELWVTGDVAVEEGDDVKVDGPIFVVHGRDHLRMNEVARLIADATDREAVILAEQTDGGRFLLEKFSDHAGAAAFAVVLLTGDDEGGLKGSGAMRSRGRQNVVLELGYFLAKLGRKRVVVLADEGVEEPSDINGLIYKPLDTGGAWKYKLANEMREVGISVDLNKIKTV